MIRNSKYGILNSKQCQQDLGFLNTGRRRDEKKSYIDF
jgi:hypothetical protein